MNRESAERGPLHPDSTPGRLKEEGEAKRGGRLCSAGAVRVPSAATSTAMVSHPVSVGFDSPLSWFSRFTGFPHELVSYGVRSLDVVSPRQEVAGPESPGHV